MSKMSELDVVWVFKVAIPGEITQNLHFLECCWSHTSFTPLFWACFSANPSHPLMMMMVVVMVTMIINNLHYITYHET